MLPPNSIFSIKEFIVISYAFVIVKMRRPA